jgi:hypothetical protein
MSFAAAYARVQLGVHSLDQVLFGLIIGVWLSFFFHAMVRNQLKNKADQVFKDKEDENKHLLERKPKIVLITEKYEHLMG